MKRNIKSWGELLCHAKFAFNRAPSKATGLSPFQVVYENNPRTPLDLVPLPNATKFSWEAEKFNEQAKFYANKKRREAHFQPGDLVWVHLRNEGFPSKRKSKLLPRSDGPFEVLEKIGPNAYKIDLPGDYGVSATFNVADLSPYYDEEEELPSLRSNSNQAGGNDGDHHDQASSTQPASPHILSSSKEVKNTHALVKEVMEHSDRTWADSSENWPGFVHLLGLEGERMNDCLAPSL